MADWTLILLSEATTLPTEPQPTDLFNNIFLEIRKVRNEMFLPKWFLFIISFVDQ